MKKSAFPLALISLLFPLLVEAQSVYVPVIHVADELDLGVALSNPTLESVTVLLTARSYSGEQIAKDGVTNPGQVKLPPGGQRALRAAEIFGAGMEGQAGWIEVASSPAVKASFAIFDAALRAVDGAAAMRPSGRLIFPKVSGSTQIALANVGSRPLSDAGISLYANDGAIVARKIFQLSAFSGLAGTLTDLIPEASAFEGYAVVSSAGTPFSQTSETLIGTEIYRNRSDIAVLNALNDTSYTKAGYAPHLIGQNIYDTRVILINPAAEAQVVRLTADGLKVDGQPLRPPSASAERTIPGLGRLDESLDRLLDFSGEALLTGYVRYEIQGNTPGLIGYAEYLTTNGGMLSAVPLQSVGFSDLYFSHVVEGDGFYTGLALLNPGTRPALATVDLFDREGTMIGSTTLSLEAGGQTAQLLKDLFSKAGVQRGGSIHVTATRPIIAFQFFGSSTSPDFWASVPAEGIQLPAQPAGRPVRADTGARVISADGSASIAIPPGALREDTIVRLQVMDIASLPDPSTDSRIISAVNAQPEGAQFKLPVRVWFSIATELPPGTVLPLLLFDQTTRRYAASEFVAVVDDTGRAASAAITHFSIFVAAVPQSRLINISDVSPRTGLAGTAVVISGSGFSANPLENTVTFAGVDGTTVNAVISAATAGSLTVTVPPAAVTGNIIVRVGTRSSIGVNFVVLQLQPRPLISSVAPDSAPFGTNAADIQIRGSGFSRTTTVEYDGTAVNATFVDSSLMLLTISAQQLEPAVHQIVIRNPAPGGGESNAALFTVPYPVPFLVALTPARINAGAQALVTIGGTGLSRSATVLVDGSAVAMTFVNASAVQITAAGLSPGTHGISVINPTPGGGRSNTVYLTAVAVAAAPVPISAVVILDPASNAPAKEVVVNEGNTIRVPLLIFDTAGKVRTDVATTYVSLSPDIATADNAGNIQGKRIGFSTLIVRAGAALATATITVARIDSTPSGFEASGVVQDASRRLYLAATEDQTIRRADDLLHEAVLYAGTPRSPGFKDDKRLSALFRNPAFLALNQADGSLYVGDAANNRIRRVRAGAEGRVETLAGTGIAGSQDGLVAQSQFNNPQGTALDNRGNLWVADSGNHTIRRINFATGQTETIAGQAGSPGFADGAGKDARFDSPAGIAVEIEPATAQIERERRGGSPPPVSVIVADSGNGLVRRVHEDGQVDTLTGFDILAIQSDLPESKSGLRSAVVPARFSKPTAVALDGAGNIFVVTETGIRVVLRTGDIVAGAQAGSFGNPRGIAVQEEGGLVVTEAHTAPRRLTYGAPAIISIDPKTIDSRGGDTVTVKGRNFSPETIVVLAGILISSAQVQDTETITFRAPKLPSGKATLTLQNRGGIGQAPFVLKPVPLNALAIGAITTIAGSSTFAGDGGPAKQSGLDLPQAVAVDESGNVYIADTNHDRVRKVDRLTGIITTIAGTGQNGYSGDGGLAIAARLSRPLGLAFASNGDLYILDQLNQSVRKVSAATGKISTVSGGFSYPRGLAIDGSGNLFIADSGNHRIRRIDAAGIITTIAGDGIGRFGGDGGPATSASLQFPESIAIDANGNLFIADSGNARIRRVDSQTKMITTVAGGDGFLDEPQGISVDADGNVIFVDAPGPLPTNSVVWVLSAADGGLRELVAESTYAAPKLDALSTTVDGAGNVVIADGFNNLVRRFDRVAGTLRTLAGVSGDVGDGGPAFAASLSGPTDVKFDLAGNMLIADSGNHRIRRISAADGRITTIAGNGSHGFDGDGGPPGEATLWNPSNVAVDRLGNIFISDSGNNVVRRIDADLKSIRTVVGTGDFDHPYNGDGPASGTATALNNPAGLAFDLDGNLLIADQDNNRIRKYDVSSGIVTTIAGSGPSGRLEGGYSGDNGPATSALLNAPVGVAVDRSGNIFIADSLNGAVRRIDAKSGKITTVFSPEWFVSGVAFDSSGNLFVTGFHLWRLRADGQISKIAGDGGDITDDIPASRAALYLPLGLAIDNNGNIFLAERFGNSVRAIRGPVP